MKIPGSCFNLCTVGKRSVELPGGRLDYPSELPVSDYRDEIIHAIQNNQVIIVSGETGCGKTTQIPKMCIESAGDSRGITGCTQPRRIATLSIAQRLGEELGNRNLVGSKIRFRENVHCENRVKFMTDGILLAEAQSDRWLRNYHTLVIDEAHERSVNIDVILAMLKLLVKRRKDLRVVVTSATLETDKFSNYFDNAPVISIPGRNYPVRIYYRPGNENLPLVRRVITIVEEVMEGSSNGDILVFMPTVEDINECVKILNGRYRHADVLPLFARLPVEEQRKIFDGSSGRKIIIATNIAETSLTIPGIHYVVDSGLARMSRYYPITGTQGLPVELISRASADQRAGRAGRIAEGICLRMYSEEDYLSRPMFTEPEIKRSNLAGVTLRLLSLGLDDIEEFSLMDPPSSAGIRDSLRTLREVGAIDLEQSASTNRNVLSKTGYLMSNLPIDPRLAWVLLRACDEGCLGELLPIVAVLGVRDPHESGPNDRKRSPFTDEHSDFITLLNIWKSFHGFMSKSSFSSRLKRFCSENTLSFQRMREWIDVHHQLEKIMADSGYKAKPFKDTGNKKNGRGGGVFSKNYSMIHRCLLGGFLSHVIQKQESGNYMASRKRKVYLHPSSTLFKSSPQWILALDFVKTSRLFARSLAEIEHVWIEEVGQRFLTRSWKGPQWSKERGQVIAREEARLFGLLVYNDKIVNYGKVKPQEARMVFVNSALVPGNFRQGYTCDFLVWNQGILKNLREMEERMRRRDIVANDRDIAEFYDNRLPVYVCDQQSLDNYIRKNGDTDLRMKEEDVCTFDMNNADLKDFPDDLLVNGERLKLSYNFDIDSEDDGVTLKIPAGRLSGLPDYVNDWIVPGLLGEKVERLIRGLDKKYRRPLIPIGQTVAEALAGLDRDMPLLSALGQWIHKNKGVQIPVRAWPKEGIPKHFRLRLALVDKKGEILSSSRGGMHELGVEYQERDDNKIIMKNLTVWPKDLWNGLLEPMESGFWPALCDDGNTVSLRLFSNRILAEKFHMEAQILLARLYWSREISNFMQQTGILLPENSLVFGTKEEVESAMWDKVASEIFASEIIKTQDEWGKYLSAKGGVMFSLAEHYVHMINGIFHAYADSRQILLKMRYVPHRTRYIDSLIEDMDELVSLNFIKGCLKGNWENLARWLRAIPVRARRGNNDPSRDHRALSRWLPYMNRFTSIINETPEYFSPEKMKNLIEAFSLIQEFKVMLFAQSEIRVSGKVSESGITAILDNCEIMV